MNDLPQAAFRRYDETPDELFYEQPRFVVHIDESAIGAVTDLYREFFPPGGEILDLMSSWVSHLPPEIAYRRVVGQGMNRAELEGNARLDELVVQNLNEQTQLPFADAAFDAAGICVSIQYLAQPVDVLREVTRVLRAGAPVVITFSNRCFPTKAVAVWQATDDAGHAALVERYLQRAGNWRDIQKLDRTAPRRGVDPLYAVVARKS